MLGGSNRAVLLGCGFVSCVWEAGSWEGVLMSMSSESVIYFSLTVAVVTKKHEMSYKISNASLQSTS